MNQKEIGKLRRRLKPEKNNITSLYGCFVNANREIVAYLDSALSMLKEEEGAVYLDRLRRCLSGTPDRNLMDIAFTTAQVAGSREHALLSALYRSNCQDEEARETLYQTIIQALDLPDTNYVILLAADSYDVPHKGADDETFAEGSDQVFRYVLCAVCPVKDATADLRFFYETNEFHISSSGPVVGNTALGFLFPAFDDRATNLYNALYYAQKPAELHEELIQALFRTEAPMSAPAQQETFHAMLTDALGEDLSFAVAQAVHEQLNGRIEQHKADKDPEPLTVSPREVAAVLWDAKVSPQRIEAFEEAAEQALGDDGGFRPANLVSKKFEIETPTVKITTTAEYSGAIKTGTVQGRTYILVPAEEEVLVNGVPVEIGN